MTTDIQVRIPAISGWISVIYQQQIEPGKIVISRMREFHLRKPSDGDAIERIVWVSEEYPNGKPDTED